MITIVCFGIGADDTLYHVGVSQPVLEWTGLSLKCGQLKSCTKKQ